MGNLNEEFKIIAQKAGLYIENAKLIKLHKKFFKFLKTNNLSAAAAISSKLGKFYEFLVNALILYDKNPNFSLASFKRAALINPIFNFCITIKIYFIFIISSSFSFKCGILNSSFKSHCSSKNL
jgi:hypothetical protein